MNIEHEIFLGKMSCITKRELSIALIILAIYKKLNIPYEIKGHKTTFANELRSFLQNLFNIRVIRG